METAGAVAFGLVIGWITYRTLRRSGESAGISDIAAVIGAVGGATVTGLFEAAAFSAYAIGLAIGFFGYFIVGYFVDKNAVSKPSESPPPSLSAWMM
jgi:O-antigen/teichoic acid export membrane protein